MADARPITARVRRLSSTGERLYVQFSRDELRDAGIEHGTPVSISLQGSCTVGGVVKTSGATPWLAPGSRWSNQQITGALRSHGFDHGDDVPAMVICEASFPRAAPVRPPRPPKTPLREEPVPIVATKRAPGSQRLAEEIERLSMTRVRLGRWDEYILDREDSLGFEIHTAGRVAELEKARWEGGRFPQIQLAVADAIFSKQKKYRAAVVSCVRPFAQQWGSLALEEFCRQDWQTVFERCFKKPPRSPDASSHHHLSMEGRVRSILDASETFLRLGLHSTQDANQALREQKGARQVRSALRAVSGVSDALIANICMNLGSLQVKADTHIRAVVSECCAVPPTAPDAVILQQVDAAAQATGRHPFEIDQILW